MCDAFIADICLVYLAAGRERLRVSDDFIADVSSMAVAGWFRIVIEDDDDVTDSMDAMAIVHTPGNVVQKRLSGPAFYSVFHCFRSISGKLTLL